MNRAALQPTIAGVFDNHIATGQKIMNRMMFVALTGLLLACSQPDPQVVIKTAMGDITISVNVKQAPITGANFLRHVERGSYAGGTFYRVVRDGNQPNNDVKIAVIQGGLGDRAEEHEPIPHESTEQTGLLHLDGVVSMARLEPGTATTEIFICVGPQPELDFGGRRNPDGQGFAAFGQVINGMDVVRAIHRLPAVGQYLDPGVIIRAMTRD